MVAYTEVFAPNETLLWDWMCIKQGFKEFVPVKFVATVVRVSC